MSRLENSVIELNLVTVGDKGNQVLEKMAEKHIVSWFFAAADVDSLVLSLKLWVTSLETTFGSVFPASFCFMNEIPFVDYLKNQN